MLSEADSLSREEILQAKARMPEDVVFRSFVKETVVLNLATGKYHGLNPTAGRMLEVLDKSRTVADAVSALAKEYQRPVEEVEQDTCDFCEALASRDLISLDQPQG